MRKIPSRGKSIAALAIVVAAVIGTVAYLGTGTGGVSATEVKETALGSMENVDTFKMDVTTTMGIGTQENPFELTTYMEGTVDRKDRKMRATMRTLVGSENVEYTMYLVDNTAYVNMSAMIPENAPRPENFSGWIKKKEQSWESQDRFGMQKELLERAKVERLEDEEVNGVKCHVLRMEPTENYWNYFIKNTLNQEGITSIGENALEAAENLSAAFENTWMKGWYSGESGLPLKTQFVMEIDMKRLAKKFASEEAPTEGIGGTASLEMSIKFSDFNEPVSIELPEGARDAVSPSVLENLGEESETAGKEAAKEAGTAAENAAQAAREAAQAAREAAQAAREAAQDNTSPTISIIEPEESLVTSNDTVKVSGSVSDDIASYDEITLTVKGNSVTVQSDGSFSTTVSLEEGTNNINVVATDGMGNSSSKTITVRRK